MTGGLLWVVVITALAFDFTNGFHDTANAVATTVSTRALTPRVAVLIAAVMNLLGALTWTAVASTVGSGLIDTNIVTQQLLFAALLGAIAWNLSTWYLGLPSSSSHALIGGLVGAAIAAQGTSAVQWGGLYHKVVVPAVQSPVFGFLFAAVLLVAAFWLVSRLRPSPVNHGFRLGQIASGSVVAFLHGTNDAQKTMGVIALALFSSHRIDHFYIPWYVKVGAGIALAAGTYVGGWRIMRTMGSRIFALGPSQGFSAQVSTSIILFYTARSGFPISTTQVIGGSVVGVGAATRASRVRWEVAAQILTGWVITLPAAAIAAALAYRVLQTL